MITEKRLFYGLWSVLLLFTQLTYCICTERDNYPFAQGTLSQSLSIEKGRAVLYRDLVTILRMALMHYITKLVTSDDTKSETPIPPNKNIK